jgi:hypothetical protein
MNDLFKVCKRKRFKQNFDGLYYKKIIEHPHQPKTNDNKKTNRQKVPQVAKKERRTMEEQPCQGISTQALS